MHLKASPLAITSIINEKGSTARIKYLFNDADRNERERGGAPSACIRPRLWPRRLRMGAFRAREHASR